MLYTGARERKTKAERGRHGGKTKGRHGGGWALEKERNCYEVQGEKELEKMPQRLRQWSQGKCSREMDRQTYRQTANSIKSLDQSGEETDETVWKQYDAAIGLIDPKPNRIKERGGTAGSCSHRHPPPRLSLSIRWCMNVPLTKIYQEWFIDGVYLN